MFSGVGETLKRFFFVEILFFFEAKDVLWMLTSKEPGNVFEKTRKGKKNEKDGRMRERQKVRKIERNMGECERFRNKG